MKAIEAHATTMNLPKSVLVAVMQAQGWASGKEVSEETFREAVRAFLEGPMGGSQ
jgi:2-methylaconitate cis-trans-isomerase PrpF